MELSERARSILAILGAGTNYVPAEKIAAEIGVSARTVTREMHGIEMSLMPYGITLFRAF